MYLGCNYYALHINREYRILQSNKKQQNNTISLKFHMFFVDVHIFFVFRTNTYKFYKIFKLFINEYHFFSSSVGALHYKTGAFQSLVLSACILCCDDSCWFSDTSCLYCSLCIDYLFNDITATGIFSIRNVYRNISDGDFSSARPRINSWCHFQCEGL